MTESGWLSLKYDNTTTEYKARYSFVMEKSASKHKTFLIVEDLLKGLQAVRRHYFLEEIQNKEGLLRVSLFSKVSNQQEARHLTKQLKSLRNAVQAGDRNQFVVSSWNQISVYAS